MGGICLMLSAALSAALSAQPGRLKNTVNNNRRVAAVIVSNLFSRRIRASPNL
jgi:hypothetical protein